MKFNTKLLHGKAGRNTPDGATLPGISQVSAFSYDSAEHLEKVFGNKAPGFAYTRIGNPTVANATVEASVVANGRGKKVIVYKYKRKTGYHKKNGHRQYFTKVKIEKING